MKLPMMSKIAFSSIFHFDLCCFPMKFAVVLLKIVEIDDFAGFVFFEFFQFAVYQPLFFFI